MRLRTRARTRTLLKAADAADASSDDEEEEEPEEGQLGARTLSQILAAEIAERFDDGFVVDGLACAYASPKTLARALVRALRLKKADALPEEPPEDAPEDWQPAKEAEGAFALQGLKRLVVVSLDADDAVAGKRERAEKEAAEKAAWALANPEEAAAEAAEAGAEATDEKPDEEKPDGDEEKTSEDANANEEEADEPYEYQAAADAAAHRAMVAEVLPLFGSPTASNYADRGCVHGRVRGRRRGVGGWSRRGHATAAPSAGLDPS